VNADVHTLPLGVCVTTRPSCHPEWAWVLDPPKEMKVAVILSEAKDLQFRSNELMQILRFAQNERLSTERSEGSLQFVSPG
jgi:hypothetical protein